MTYHRLWRKKKSGKEIKKDNLPDKCKGCPYYRGNGYCFPCMKDLMKPDNSKCDTQNEGLIKCMRAINRVAVQLKNRKIDESDIQEYMMTGKTNLPKEFKEIMDQQIHEFVDRVYRYQTECGYNLDMMPVYFVGGGAIVMRNFGKYQQNNIHYVLDVRANAKGFETMARIALRRTVSVRLVTYILVSTM